MGLRLYSRRQLFLLRFLRLYLNVFLLFLLMVTVFLITTVVMRADPIKIRIREIIGAMQIFPHGGDRFIQYLFLLYRRR